MAELEQQRILKTPIPGPRSLELMARKTGAVARGIGTTMPGSSLLKPAAVSWSMSTAIA